MVFSNSRGYSKQFYIHTKVQDKLWDKVVWKVMYNNNCKVIAGCGYGHLVNVEYEIKDKVMDRVNSIFFSIIDEEDL